LENISGLELHKLFFHIDHMQNIPFHIDHMQNIPTWSLFAAQDISNIHWSWPLKSCQIVQQIVLN